MAHRRDDLRHLWRWSLLRVSLTSQIDAWPNALFLALFHLGRESEALRRAELLSEPNRKVAVLGQLASLIDTATAQRVWNLAHATVATISNDRHRAAALRALVLAMAQAEHPDAAATFALAATAAAADDGHNSSSFRFLDLLQDQYESWDATTTTATGIDHKERASALHVLYGSLLQAGNTYTIRRSIGTAWRCATTRTELLTLAKVAYPLLSADPSLGGEMVAVFAWVDAQLHEG